jgi:membrane protein implicated in regulation of membrane protease activity
MDAQWVLWLGLALIAGAAEIFTLSLVFAMVAGGALAAAVVAALTGSVVASVITFAVSTGLLMLAVRPPLMKYSRRELPSTLTGTAGLIDREAIVVEEVTGRSGQVKLAGEVWSARAARSGGPLEVGAPVRVVAIEGATAVVTPLPPHAALPGGATPSDGPEPLA